MLEYWGPQSPALGPDNTLYVLSSFGRDNEGRPLSTSRLYALSNDPAAVAPPTLPTTNLSLTNQYVGEVFGGDGRFRLTVTNQGPAVAPGVKLEVRDVARTYRRMFPATSGVSCTPTDGEIITCSLGSVGVGQTVTINIDIVKAFDTGIPIEATVFGDLVDAQTSDNFAVARTSDAPAPPPTITPTPGTPTPVPLSCTPRPRINVQVTSAGPNRIQATISATGAGNSLARLDWTTPANAAVELPNGTAIPTGLTPAAGTTSVTFIVRRLSGSGVTLPVTVQDGCGVWPTFVGAGASAW
jgi:hypothetical protein